MMLGKRKSSRAVAPVKKRRKGEPAIEEITFDFGAREEYLTGFHKRKLQRVKHAKEEALKKEREEKIAARKVVRYAAQRSGFIGRLTRPQLRENRRVDREKHVEAVNAAVRGAEDLDVGGGSSDGQSANWNGIEEAENVDHEDDYMDEDRHTVVTVEAVDVSRDGLQRRKDEPGSEDENTQVGTGKAADGRNPNGRTVNGNRSRSAQQSRDHDSRPKKKKKKFRYESKAERKVTRFKERSGGKAKAKVRRE